MVSTDTQPICSSALLITQPTHALHDPMPITVSQTPYIEKCLSEQEIGSCLIILPLYIVTLQANM